ncbi:ripply transcriptional repressor 1 [Cricetulus griseus]
MDPTAPAAAPPGLALAQAPAVAQINGQEVSGSGRLFWPKSRSFDYLYSAGEILLQNFPVQATINLYEDSDSNEDEEDKEEDEEEEVNEIGSEEGARVPEATEHKATAHSPEPPLTCPN